VRLVLAVVWNLLALLRAPFFFARRVFARRRMRWLHVRLRRRVVAIPAQRPFWTRWVPLAAQAEATPLARLIELGDTVEADAGVEGVVLEIPMMAAGWAVLADLRDVLARIRRSGKRVVAYLPEGAGHKELYLASACDRVLVGRHATLVAPGLASVRTYGRSLLAKLGVSLEVHRRAEFKTAVEGLVEESMSEPQREQAKAIVDGLEAELVHALAERPNLDEDGVRAIFARAMITAEEAVSLGLADAVVHDDELRSALVDEGKPAPTLVRAPVYLALVKAKLFRPFVLPRVIAVVPILGAIGEAGPPGSASREQLVPTLRRLARERRVAAVVLYVDSPGGSALASERIHREVELLATKKPVVACFGDVAASGGYYVAEAIASTSRSPSAAAAVEGLHLGQVLDEARRMAAHLQSMGLSRGDRVAILSKNCAHFFIAELAIWIGGFTTVAIFPTEGADTIRFVLEHSEAKFCCSSASSTPGRSRSPACPRRLPCIAFPLAPPTKYETWDAIVARTEPLRAGSPARPTTWRC
jgi:protease-4